ncbi:cytochrome c biogenesis protein DipZ [Mycobacterium sp. ITM-2016-00318]|uniref:cytochrome c biogenesis protein DipZ n=1 Tax=Mycobacterium sp. ITM-2016-00318 TaxID=2099693 RepID=UPI000CF8B163|nr:cytochrome c biogenesis protein DipZ [Mycobacterium sp. ITM-2016-00318]WNG94794.1 cytochrome c biogenesis protein DipZ [Mycobacterium sp. ITM-2016-00318]
MLTLVLIGCLGGLITGVSPCILPVLPVIFFSGTHGSRSQDTDSVSDAGGGTAVAVAAKPALSERLRPYRVIGGLVLSFSVVTLVGTSALSLLHLPQDAIRWAGLVALTAIGLGLVFPRFEQILEKPFSRIPTLHMSDGKSGFGLGLALGVLYVPCAGPVLAAIVVAGATGSIGLDTVALTIAFAVGAALPLLFFALAGQRVAERVGSFRRHQRRIRVIGGIVMLVFALVLVFNMPAKLQRAIPDYTGSLQDKVVASDEVRKKLDLGGLVNDQNRELSNCTNGAAQLERCGTAPDIKGIAGYLNTPGGASVDLGSLRGKVVLVDFWAYSCINCQRAIPHVVDWYAKYRDAGFEVIGVHSPEYAFEKNRANVASGAAELGITYPVALDNNLSTWTNYRNRYWPAEYLIDANGTVRHIKFGEGDYDVTENLIRQLLLNANPDEDLPAATASVDQTPTAGQTPETYLGVGKMVNYGGPDTYDEGTTDFVYPLRLADDTFAYRGRWRLDYQGATAESDDSRIALKYNAKNVYIVAGGEGTVTVIGNGRSRTVPITGAPTSYQLVARGDVGRGELEVRLSRGLQAFSFTYG